MNTLKITESGVRDLTEQAEIDKALSFFGFDGTEIVIDISDCFISYDTACLFDRIISKITDSTIPKKIYLKTDYKFISEETMWDWLFRDTSLFGDEAKRDGFNIIDAIKNKYNITFLKAETI